MCSWRMEYSVIHDLLLGRVGPGSDFLEVREWVKGRTETSPLLGQRGEEVVFSTDLLFFCCHSPGYLPRLRGAAKSHTCFTYASTVELLQGLFSVLYSGQAMLNSAQRKKGVRSQFVFSPLCCTEGIYSIKCNDRLTLKTVPFLSAFSGSSWTCTDNTPSITNILKPRAGECLKPQPYNVMKNTHSCSNNHIII